MEEDEEYLFGMTDLILDDEERQDNSSNLDEEFIKPTNIIFETEEEPHQTNLFPQGEIEVVSPEIRDIKIKNKDLEEEYLFEQEKINLDDEVEEADNVPDDNDFLLKPTELVYEDPLEKFNMRRENSQSVNPLKPLNSNILEEEKIISYFNEENNVMGTKDEDKKELMDDGKNKEVNKVEIKEEIKLENNEMKMDDVKKIGENEEVKKEADTNIEKNEEVLKEAEKNNEINEVAKDDKNIEKNEEVLIEVETNIEKKEEVKNEEDTNIEKNEEIIKEEDKKIETNEEVEKEVDKNIGTKEEVLKEADRNIEKNEEIQKEEDKNIDTKEEVEKEVDTKIETNEETKKVEDTNIEKNEEDKNNVDKLDEEVKQG